MHISFTPLPEPFTNLFREGQGWAGFFFTLNFALNFCVKKKMCLIAHDLSYVEFCNAGMKIYFFKLWSSKNKEQAACIGFASRCSLNYDAN